MANGVGMVKVNCNIKLQRFNSAEWRIKVSYGVLMRFKDLRGMGKSGRELYNRKP